MIGFPFDSQVTYEEDGTPVYDRAITSIPLRQLIKKMLSNGVLPNPSTNLQVQPGTGMNVIVNPGFAIIEGGLKYEEAQRTLAVQASDTAYDRIDTVVLRWNDNANARNCDLYVVQGTPAASPVRPSLNRAGSVYELGLADLFIVANSSAISAARITDTRYEEERCGIISSIAEFDSDAIYQQVQADLAEFQENEQAEFVAWFERIVGLLSEDAAGNLQLQIDDINKQLGNGGTPIVTTEGSGTAYTATVEGVKELTVGMKITIIPHTASTSVTPTFNLNNLGAIKIYQRLDTDTSTVFSLLSAGFLASGKPITLMYNGVFWVTEITRTAASNLYGTVQISKGGTGATNVAGARNALGLGNTSGALPIANGGTDATNAEDALTNLGAVSKKFMPQYATTNKIFPDALYADFSSPFGTDNEVGYVVAGSTEHLPSNCAFGIREVYWYNTTTLIVKITGVSTDNLNKITEWYALYSNGWNGWTEVGAFIESVEFVKNTDITIVTSDIFKMNSVVYFSAQINCSNTGLYKNTYFVIGTMSVKPKNIIEVPCVCGRETLFIGTLCIYTNGNVAIKFAEDYPAGTPISITCQYRC